MPPLTQEQLAARRSFLGASEAPTVAGLNPWRGKIDVWLEKMGRAERSESDALELGHDVEEIVCRRYARTSGLELVPGDSQIHPEYPWAAATPDRIAPAARRIVEAKNVGARVAHHWTDDTPPPYVVAQVQWQLMCCRLDGEPLTDAAVIALIGGRDFKVYEGILPDAEIQAALLSVCDEFWREHVLTGIAPEVDGSESARTYIESLFPRNTRPLVEAPEEALEWARRLRDAKAELEAVELRKGEAENHLKQLIGDADGIFGAFGRLTWKAPADRKVTDWEALAKAKGATAEDIAAHTTAKPQGRRFLAQIKESF